MYRFKKSLLAKKNIFLQIDGPNTNLFDYEWN